MPSTIVVPQLSESVTEARVGRWLKKEGDRVAAGDAIVELETDKVDLEVGAEATGVLTEILHEEGDEIHAGDELAVITPSDREEDESRATAEPAGGEDSGGAEEQSGEAEARGGEELRRPASPSARRLAREEGVELSAVAKQAEGDRITHEDIERFVERRKSRQAEQAQDEDARDERREGGEGRREELVRMSGRRRTIARRLVEAQRDAAMLTTFNEIDMSSILSLREEQQERFFERHDVHLGIVSFFVRATIGALRSFPRLNAEVRGDSMLLKHYYDIGVAVGDPEGLVVPVLRDADRLPLAEIERGIKELASKAREGRLGPNDLEGGTFTITNGGVFGSLLSTPILNPPQVGILGLHKIEERAHAIRGRLEVRPMMYVALTYDHRIVDGLEAVQFLIRVKELIESPSMMLLDG
jgi:2-oxoglutarate dehydrogenase E2 component (dihydrolipoamide succinyltransferase)